MRNLALLLRARQIPFVLLINEHPPALELLRREGLPFEVIDLTLIANWAPDVIRHHKLTQLLEIIISTYRLVQHSALFLCTTQNIDILHGNYIHFRELPMKQRSSLSVTTERVGQT